MKQQSVWIEWGLVAIAAVLLLAALVFPLAAACAEELTADEQSLLNAYQNNEVIRLHILANSDSPKDQEVKYAVRDAILKAFGNQMANADDVYQMLADNVSGMEETARQTAAKLGFEGDVHAETGWLELPEKSYGQIILSEGLYRGLRITLGEGKGQNWWCVLYPNLCLELMNAQPQPRRWLCVDVLRHWLITPVQTDKNVI